MTKTSAEHAASPAPSPALQLAEVARLTHFVHAPNLQETVWRLLPAIAEGMGVKVGGLLLNRDQLFALMHHFLHAFWQPPLLPTLNS